MIARDMMKKQLRGELYLKYRLSYCRDLSSVPEYFIKGRPLTKPYGKVGE